MQMKLDKSDRRLLLWTGAILIAPVALLVVFSDGGENSRIPSSNSSSSAGAKAAYLYLQEAGYHVERWEDSPEALPKDARNTTLVLASPQGLPGDDEKEALTAYLDRGGRILATGYSSSWFLPQTDIVFEALPESVWRDYKPQIVSPLARAGVITMSPSAHWSQPAAGQLLHYTDNGQGIVVSYHVGTGEVVWWAANEPLTNAGIGRNGNLVLFLNSVSGSKSARILWDEYFHSPHEHEDVSASAWVPPLRYGFWQCLAVFAALVLTFGRRNAPIRQLREPSRLSPLEFVQTLGNLYRRANSTRTALEVPYHRFRSLLIRRLALRSDVSPADLIQSASKRFGYRDPDFEQTMVQAMNALNDPEIKEATVLELVQRLSRHACNLKLTSQQEQ